jgi:hypothetical protein
MKFALLLCLLLASCAPLDPNGMIAAGNAALASTRAAQSEREQALQWQQAQSTLEAGSTQSALDAELSKLSITQTAVELRATDAAATSAAYQAKTAYYATSTAVFISAQGAQIAATRQQAQANADAILWLVFRLALSAIILWLVLISGRAFVQVYIVRRTTLTTDRGYVLPDKVGSYTTYQFIPYQQLTATIDAPARDIPVNDWRKKPTTRMEVLELVGRSIQLQGGASNVIPSDDKLGMSSEKWQRVTGILKQAATIYSIPGQGTFVLEEIGSLRDLLSALNRGEVTLPLPAEDR